MMNTKKKIKIIRKANKKLSDETLDYNIFVKYKDPQKKQKIEQEEDQGTKQNLGSLQIFNIKKHQIQRKIQADQISQENRVKNNIKLFEKDSSQVQKINTYDENKQAGIAGCQDFFKFYKNSPIFVDKSLLINKFIQHKNETILVTYPRRWGKSLNMKVDKNGNKLAEEQKQYSKMFTINGNPKLNISEEQVIQMQGQYPVVYVDLKSTKKSDYKSVFEAFQNVFVEVYQDHQYLLKSNKITDIQKQLMKKFLSESSNLTKSEIEFSILRLCNMLFSHFGQNCIVLIDEYDACINHLALNQSPDLDKVNDLFRDLFEASFKGNKYLYKGLITGVFRISKANFFSGLNNLGVVSIANDDFSSEFGFTEDDVQILNKQYGIDSSTKILIKQYYNGYKVGKDHIYNPWSMVHCFQNYKQGLIQNLNEDQIKEKVFQNYWALSGSINLITPIFKKSVILKQIKLLLQDYSIKFKLNQDIIILDYKQLVQIMKGSISIQSLDDSIQDLFFSYLFAGGYLTQSNKQGEFDIPNIEIKLEIFKLISSITYQKQVEIGFQNFQELSKSLQALIESIIDSKDYENSCDHFKRSYKQFLELFPSFGVVNKTRHHNNQNIQGNENFIQSTMVLLQKFLQKASSQALEFLTDQGRADIIFKYIYNCLRHFIVIFEIKYGQTAQIAFNQIIKNKYGQQFNNEFDLILICLNVSEQKEISILYQVVKQNNYNKFLHE